MLTSAARLWRRSRHTPTTSMTIAVPSQSSEYCSLKMPPPHKLKHDQQGDY